MFDLAKQPLPNYDPNVVRQQADADWLKKQNPLALLTAMNDKPDSKSVWDMISAMPPSTAPSQAALAQTPVAPGEVPPFLQADPKSAPGIYPEPAQAMGAPSAPSLALPPQGGPPPSIPGSLSQVPVVPPRNGLPTYLTANRAQAQAEKDKYDVAARQAMADQQGGLDQIKDYINQIQGQPQRINFSPLAAYVDSMTGSKLTPTAQAMAPMTPEEQQQKLMDLQFKLQGARQSLSQNALNDLRQQMQMQHQNMMDAATVQHYQNEDRANQTRADSYGQRILTQKDQQAQAAAQVFDKDPYLIQLGQRRGQIDIDYHTLKSTNAVPSQMMAEMAMGLATALSGGKQAGLEQTKMVSLNSVQGDIAKIKSWGGTPYNALTDGQRQFLEQTFDRLRDAYADTMIARGDQLRNGRNFSYNPAANQVLDAKNQGLKNLKRQPDPAFPDLKIGDIQEGHKYIGGLAHDPGSWEAQ